MTNHTSDLPIVVGLDSSEHAAPALRWAADRAARTGSRVRLVHAAPSSAYLASATLGLVPVWQDQAGEPDHEAHDRTLQQWLDREAHALAQERGLTAEAHLAFGSPAAALVEESATAALVVVGSRGRGAFAGTMLGSTAQQVAGHAACPVVVVRQDPDPAVRGVAVGVDESEASRRAVDAAFDEALARGVPLRLVHAWAPSYVGTMAASYEAFEAASTGEREAGEHLLAVTARDLHARAQELTIEQRLTRLPPGPALVEESATAELVVVGTRGRGGFAGLVLGSVSSAALHHATCPVMVVA
jgi:nucleotide-binding universal stress UspA family protein